MKSTTDFHREALDQALRIALGTSQPALRRQALARAATHLIHPKLILDSPLLTDSHSWRREALLVSDAFEAVTNGMEDPSLLEALEDLGHDSPFLSWRHLILAIHFYYEGLDEAVTAHLDAIPAESPVQVLAKTLGLACGSNVNRASAHQRRLAELLAQPDPLVQQWVQDVAEGLETGHEALFWGALADWLEYLAPRASERAQAAVLWAWNQLEWQEFDEAVLLDLVSSLWGRAESYRLAALGSLPWDPEGAALLWARFVLTAARDGEHEIDLKEAERLLESFREAAETGDPSVEWKDTWSRLAWGWNAEKKARGWTSETAEFPSPVTAASTHGQLDLFA